MEEAPLEQQQLLADLVHCFAAHSAAELKEKGEKKEKKEMNTAYRLQGETN
jgi:hypothetical protein